MQINEKKLSDALGNNSGINISYITLYCLVSYDVMLRFVAQYIKLYKNKHLLCYMTL